MSKLRQIIVLSLCLASVATWGQNRFSASSRAERNLSKVKGFSSKDANKSRNALGLHSSTYTGSGHYLGFSVDGGWSTFLTNIQGVQSTPGGWAANGKFLYEFHTGNFFLQTGVGVGIQRVTTPVKTELLPGSSSEFLNGFSNQEVGKQYPIADPYDGARFHMKHVFSERSDMAELYYAQLPVNFGYYISSQGGVGYVMLGAQINYAFGGKTSASATCTSYAVSEKYIGVFEEMDNHGFRKDVPITSEGGKLPIRLGNSNVEGLDIVGHIEGGYEFNTFQAIPQYRSTKADNMDCRLRLAAFIDISLPSISPKGTSKLYDLNINEAETDPAKIEVQQRGLYDFHTFKMNHVLTTDVADGNKLWVRNFTIGVRFTLLFSLKPQQRCVLCDPWRH